MRRRLVTSDGRRLEHVVKEHGMSWWAVYDRIRHGDTIDQAINHFKLKPPVHRTYKGVSLRQYCKDNGISYTSISQACRDLPKLSVEDIVDKRLWIKRPEPDTKWCKERNIPYSSAKNRFRYHQLYKDEERTFKDFCKDYYKL